jgi:ABC-2 type transport system ATP-binding protein
MRAVARHPAEHDSAVAELRGATKRFGGVTALDRVDLALGAGQVTALLGPNGAGKTTAVRLLLGLLRPTSGTALLYGQPPHELAVRRRVGVMLQVAKVPETLTVREHLHLFSSYYSRPLAIDEALALAGLTRLADRRFGELSGGEQRRALFALAIAGNPDTLFLDEPTVGLDVESRRIFWAQIRRLVDEGRSILLTTHYLEEADALADRIVVLNRGGIIADGTPAEIKQRAAGRRIRCVTALDAERIARIPGVQSVRRERDAVTIATSDADAVARVLMIEDPSLRDLEISGVALEEAFLALTAEPAPKGDLR